VRVPKESYYSIKVDLREQSQKNFSSPPASSALSPMVYTQTGNGYKPSSNSYSPLLEEMLNLFSNP
jgi:hypothetical protein